MPRYWSTATFRTRWPQRCRPELTRRGGLGEFRNLSDVDTEVGETRELSARVALGWRPSPTFSMTLAADANDGDNGLNPYTTLIDEVPGGAVFAAGYRNADVAADPYDNNTGQAVQVRTSNAARGVSLTAVWDCNRWPDGQSHRQRLGAPSTRPASTTTGSSTTT